MQWAFMAVAALTCSVLAVPVVGSYGLFAAWRAKRRNADGACAACGTKWRELGPDAFEYRVQGHQVCASCAGRLRRRLAAELIGLAALTIVSGGLAIGGVLGASAHGYHFAAWAYGLLLMPPVALGTVGWGAVRRMRSLNRKALDGPESSPALGAGGA